MKTLFYSACIMFTAGIILTSCGNSTEQPVKDSLTGKRDSVTLITELIRQNPNDLDLYFRRALAYQEAKDYASAFADINRVIARDSSNSKYLLAAADIHFFTGKVQRTEQLLNRAVEVDPENKECVLRLAQLHFYLKRYDDEMQLLDKLLDKDQRNSQAWFMKGMAYKEKGDTTKAIASMQNAVQFDPDYYSAYIQLGIIAAAQKSDLAIDYYRNALEIQPNSIEAWYNLGVYQQEKKNYNAAIEAYTNILKIDPKHFDSHFNLGMIHAVRLDLTDEGMRYFNLAIEDDPTDPRGYYGRGFCFEKKGDVQSATADYKKALEVDPQYTNAALALENLGK